MLLAEYNKSNSYLESPSELVPDVEPPPSKKAKKYPKIFDGKYYSIRSDIDGYIDAVCIICHEVKKGNYLSTGNFFSHYKLKHYSKLQELKDHTKDNANKAMNQPTLSETFTVTPDNVCFCFVT